MQKDEWISPAPFREEIISLCDSFEEYEGVRVLMVLMGVSLCVDRDSTITQESPIIYKFPKYQD